jgi:hypothetical protein
MLLNSCFGGQGSWCQHKSLLAIYDAVQSILCKRTVFLRISRPPILEEISARVGDHLQDLQLTGDGRPGLNVGGPGCAYPDVVLWAYPPHVLASALGKYVDPSLSNGFITCGMMFKE